MAIDLEKARALLAAKPTSSGSSGGSDFKWYGFPKGTEEAKIRILPPLESSNGVPWYDC